MGSWHVTVIEKGQGSGNFVMSAIVTDDTRSSRHQTESVSVEGRMDNQPQKEALYDALRSQYTRQVNSTDTKALHETDAKTYLER